MRENDRRKAFTIVELIIVIAIIAILAAVLGLALRYIIKAKKSGAKCIGCSAGCSSCSCSQDEGTASSCGCGNGTGSCCCHADKK